VLEEMDAMYCTPEPESVEMRMSDIIFRDELMSQMLEAIRCKKLSECLSAAKGKEVMYCIRLHISGAGMKYEVSRNGCADAND